MNTIKIGTRASQLALVQAEWVAGKVRELIPDAEVELVHISTKGDRILDVPLARVGGKGLFVKEIEEALLDGRIDLAVHSMKDVPAELPAGLFIGIVPEREKPEDAFVSNKFTSFEDLPRGAVLGTSSLRRKAQILAKRPDLVLKDLRGNVGTRLAKLDAGEFDAIILASAGLRRLGLAHCITAKIGADWMLPAVGQGALGIELRQADDELLRRLQPLHHAATAATVAAERAFLTRLEGGCQVPIGAHAVLSEGKITLTGLIASVDGKEVLKETKTATAEEAATLGRELAESLLAQGGKAILAAVYQSEIS